jgi:ankyrin repeat protein
LFVSETARKLSEKEKKLTKTTDENGWSPLHYAAYGDWYAYARVLKVLLENDASAAYIAETEKKRTALHIAAFRGHVGIMKEIVSRCPACCELVDNRGWNALHYAVASKYSRLFEECLKIPELARLKTKKDDKGNTPFHLIAASLQNWGSVLFNDSAYFSTWLNISVVKVLLKYDASAAYIAEIENRRTALHIAAIQGHVNAMKEIVSRCPACCELVDNRGWNALHYAVASKDRVAFVHCLKIPELARLGTKKDDKGNTPFHLIAALAHQQKQWQRVLFNDSYGYSGREIRCGLNKRQLSVDDIYDGNFAEIQVINPL